MSPPAASVDFRPPSDSNSGFNVNPPTQTGNPNFHDRSGFNSGVSSSYDSINNKNVNNQSSSFSATGRSGSRTKPRLVKQRKSCKTTSSLSSDVGINLFQSVNGFSIGSDSNCSDKHVVDGKLGNLSFVFGVSNSNDRVSDGDNSNKNTNNVRNTNANVDGDQFNSSNAGFVFGGSNLNNKGNSCNISSSNAGFVFGVSSSNNSNNSVTEAVVEGSDLGNVCKNADSMKNVSVEKEGFNFSGEFGLNGTKWENVDKGGVAFSFRATAGDQVDVCNRTNGVEFGLSEELKKLNVKRDDHGGEKVEVKRNADVSSEGDPVFVFMSGGVSSAVSDGWFNPLGKQASVISSNGDDKSVNAGKTSGLGPQFASDNVFVFGSSGNPNNAGVSTSQSSSFSSEVYGDSMKDLIRSVFHSSFLDAEVGNEKPEACSVSEEKKPDYSFESMAHSSVPPFPEFKLPDFDSPLSFSSNLPNKSGRKAQSSVRARGLRDKHSRKIKTKAKRSIPNNQQPVEMPVSGESILQAEEEAECFSPMDFSPYEETTATNDEPLEVAGQSKVESGTLFGVCTESQPDKLFMNNGLGSTTADPSSGFCENTSSHDAQFAGKSDVVSDGQEKFAFAASSSVQNSVSSTKRHQKKYRMKPASVAGATSMARGSSVRGVPLFSKLDGLSGKFPVSMSTGKNEVKGNREQDRESAFSSSEKTCDKWRRRGNEAYEKGDLSEAEKFYTLGVKCIPPGNASDGSFTPLVRCYSNRAATRMALGRVREAIEDCIMAVKLDPTFHRAQMRAANCYLQLGELEDAMKCFGSIIEPSHAVYLDRQVIISASEGIRKAQKVIECTDRSSELLRLKTSEAAASALDLIVEAMSRSIYSEKLLKMKAEALCMLQRHDEAIALCHQTRDFAEKNFTAASFGDHEADNSCSNIQSWRQRALYKCHFHLGKLEMALDYIKMDESGTKTQDSSDPLAVTIGELLKEKSAGNTAFQSGKHIEAIEHYTTAILSSMESRPFAAICFCNRAAAHQALGHITDAISDCSLAIALDDNYAKAVSRRATLHEMIRDYRQAAIDLQKLISLLEKQSAGKSKQSGSGNGKELRQTRHRLSLMEDETKRDIPLDMYLILGVNKSDPASEIKKAYRKAALRHHPDKACQSLVRSDVGDEGRHWKDIAELLHKDSDRLFKMIGEAYAVLSDPTKREEYDEEEDMRKALKERNTMRSTSRRYSEHYYQGYPSERSSNRRYWQDSYKAYGNNYSKW